MLAWAERTGAGGRIWVVRSVDKGRTWSVPVQVSTSAEGYAFYQGVSIAPNGRVDVGYQAQLTQELELLWHWQCRG